MVKQYIFYKTTYIKDNRYYYGSHYGYVNDYYRGSNKIIKAIQKKSGNVLLKRENLKFFLSKEECYDFEDRFLKLFNLAGDPNSMNFKNSANGGDTWSHLSEDEKTIRKEKISRLNSGNLNANYGKPMPSARKEKMSKTKTGVHIHTEEHKKNMSERVKNEWDTGIRTYALKDYCANRKGKTNTTEWNLKISNGVINSEKYRKGIITRGINKRKQYVEQLNKYLELANNGKTNIEILDILGIKMSTLYKYKKDSKILCGND